MAQVHHFRPGDRVLLLISCATSKILCHLEEPIHHGGTSWTGQLPGAAAGTETNGANLSHQSNESVGGTRPMQAGCPVPEPTPILSFGEQLMPTQLQKLVQSSRRCSPRPRVALTVTHDIRSSLTESLKLADRLKRRRFNSCVNWRSLKSLTAHGSAPSLWF